MTKSEYADDLLKVINLEKIGNAEEIIKYVSLKIETEENVMEIS